MHVQSYISPSSMYRDREELWWVKKYDLKKELKENEELKPFVLKCVDKEAMFCSSCNWTKKCLGCFIDARDKKVDNIAINVKNLCNS